MTEKEAQRELVRIEADLEQVIEQLVKTPAAVDRWPATLKAVSAAIQRMKLVFPATVDRCMFAPMIQSIQQRMRQVNLLVESAALFYWGCVAVTNTQSAGYTHAGALEEFASGGRMQLEA